MMNDDISIKIQNLTKVYKLYNNPQDRLKEALNPFKKSYHNDFYAVKDVSFEIKKGETVGIIGKNGAGKSTLLKMITGVLTPTSGSIEVNGKIASILELGAGFNPEMTGMENIYLNGTLMGFSRNEIDTKVDGILEFADIGVFINQSVKTYSSGMYARLAFSIAINVDPDILIVDEALSVGDIRFQLKCYRKFREYQGSNKTILFVSHDTNTISNYCTHVLCLDDGVLIDKGLPEDVCKRYMSSMSYDQKTSINTLISDTTGKVDDEIDWGDLGSLESFGDKRVKIIGVSLVSNVDGSNTAFKGCESVVLKVKMIAKDNLNSIICGFTVTDRVNNIIFACNTFVDSALEISFNKGLVYIVSYVFSMPNLNNGSFNVSPAVAQGTLLEHVQHDWVHDALVITINNDSVKSNADGLLYIDDMTLEVN